MKPHLLIGNHPLLDSIRAAERMPGWPERIDPSVRHCIVAFQKDGEDGFAQDSEAFIRLKALAGNREDSVLLEILVHDPVSISLFESSDRPGVECMPFTLESQWAKILFGPGGTVHLDGDGISYADDRKVHLVLFGMTPAAEALAVGVGLAEAEEIDRINILQATKNAMRRAAARVHADVYLIDAVKDLGLDGEEVPIIRGDATSYSIAAASIVAKVTRDRLLWEMDALYPEYGFARNKGYGTAEHIEALKRLGPCPAHRRSFIGHFTDV